MPCWWATCNPHSQVSHSITLRASKSSRVQLIASSRQIRIGPDSVRVSVQGVDLVSKTVQSGHYSQCLDQLCSPKCESRRTNKNDPNCNTFTMDPNKWSTVKTYTYKDIPTPPTYPTLITFTVQIINLTIHEIN